MIASSTKGLFLNDMYKQGVQSETEAVEPEELDYAQVTMNTVFALEL